jgi:hypothetical protein
LSIIGAAIRASAPDDAPLASRPFLSDGSLADLYRPDGGAFLQGVRSLVSSFSPLLVIIHFAVLPSIPAAEIEFLEEILPFFTTTNIAGPKMFSESHKDRRIRNPYRTLTADCSDFLPAG